MSNQEPSSSPTTRVGRSEAKAARRAALLRSAAGLFAERGFTGVSMEDLGAAVGMSGPAVYRHFVSKQAVLAALLVGVSQDLLDGGTAEVERSADAAGALHSLVSFHVAFALEHPDVIRIQDHDLDSLTPDDRRTVRTLQRRYVERWVDVLHALHPSASSATLRIRALAGFGLINSTPHSASLGRNDTGAVDRDAIRSTLERMAVAALSAP
ncbi:TetR/AcrR family transcriptional regulator [Plantibacter sp. LMC-P-059a]|uniref:TetR/AcrR family transcriptional regulator n=1 Tax=Plantibacter sp. LMC-P-059a TaxID=3040297 RepID=UPI00254E4499|nr:TetR/AcrR family transcriptional regulator [Plantibacter sp. LMC-P-059a]